MTELMRKLDAAGVPYQTGAPLSDYTTFRIGGAATVLAEPRDVGQLVTVLRAAHERGVRTMLLGKGSNVLFDDRGFDGVIIRTCAVREFRIEGCEVYADCGVSLSELARAAGEAGLAGMEFAYGIPGTVGGAVTMNAGAYGGEMKDIVVFAEVYDAGRDEIRRADAGELAFGYRESVFTYETNKTVLRVGLRLVPDVREAVFARMEANIARRREKQPLNYPSAGSVFKRPRNAYAGQLIENSGLKGSRVGGAEVSTKHAGFIVNVGGATARDVTELIDRVRVKVKADSGILLEPEIRVIPYRIEKETDG